MSDATDATDATEAVVQRVTGQTWSEAGRSTLVVLPIVAVVSLFLGGLTSYAQGFLPGPLGPLANSASGWTIPTVAVVWLAGKGSRTSAVLGVVGFVGLVLGYAAVSTWRGFYYSPVFFGTVGVVAGPFVGVAASWLRRREWPAAVGAGFLGGIAIGECGYGLAVVSDTTGWFYWVLVGALGLVLLGVTLARRTSRLAPAIGGLVCALAVAAAFFFAYQGLGAL